jgi:hypothetical protein
VIDSKTGELVDKNNKRISVYSDEAKTFVCISFDDFRKVAKKLRQCGRK